MRRSIVVAALLLAVAIAGFCFAKSPNTNVLQRVFRLKSGHETGTGFTIDVEGRQYLITARHLMSDTAAHQTVELWQDSVWKPLNVTLVAPLSDSFDIAVLAPPFPISPSHPLPASAIDMVIGQDFYFLGFPSGLSTEMASSINRGFPIPFIKKAILSAMATDSLGVRFIYLDGHNNPGFSGGPAVFYNGAEKRFQVAGVVRGYRPEKLRERDSTATWREVEIWGNSGIVVVTEIGIAVEKIMENPIGPIVIP